MNTTERVGWRTPQGGSSFVDAAGALDLCAKHDCKLLYFVLSGSHAYGTSTRDLGAKRKADIETHGYSCKNAMHMIRLLRMGCEVLEGGRYDVHRPDAEELLRIRAGEWTLAEVEQEGVRLLRRLDLAAENSTLPKKVDDVFVDGMLMGLVADTLGKL